MECITWQSKYDEKISPLYLSYLFEMPEFIERQIDSLASRVQLRKHAFGYTKSKEVKCDGIHHLIFKDQFADFR